MGEPEDKSMGVTLPATGAATGTAPFRDLFDREFGYVCRALRRLGVRQGDLEDVAQELFVAVHRALPEYEAGRALRPWLFSFAFRFAANYRRLARNAGYASDGALRTLAATDHPDADARDMVLRALESLDFDRRAVIVMHDLEGFSAPEIAEQLVVPLNTVYSRLRLARGEFRDAVHALQSEGGPS
jgi:RNA polymerase sigma-70 factor (ECF subfamily)